MAKKRIKKFLVIVILLAIGGGVGFLALTDITPHQEKVTKVIDNARFK